MLLWFHFAHIIFIFSVHFFLAKKCPIRNVFFWEFPIVRPLQYFLAEASRGYESAVNSSNVALPDVWGTYFLQMTEFLENIFFEQRQGNKDTGMLSMGIRPPNVFCWGTICLSAFAECQKCKTGMGRQHQNQYFCVSDRVSERDKRGTHVRRQNKNNACVLSAEANIQIDH